MAKRVSPDDDVAGSQNEAFEPNEESVKVNDEKKSKSKKKNKIKFADVVDKGIKVKAAGQDWQNYVTRKRNSDISGPRRQSARVLSDDEESGLDMELIDPTDNAFTNTVNLSNGSVRSQSKKDSKNTFAMNKKAIEHFVMLNKLPNETAEVNLDLLSSLFAKGANVNCSDRYGQTMLHEVARTWHVDIAAFLIDNGADVTLSDRYGRTPLHVAAATDYPEMIEFLLQKGADIEARTAKENQTPLHFAARNDAVEACKILVKLGAKMEIHDYKKRTPVHVAAELDRSETARWLVEKGANVGVVDSTGQSCVTHMITKMGPVAREALDTFHKMDRTNRRQYFYLNLLEHDMSDEYSAMRNEQGMEGTLAKTPLQVIVGYKQLDIIMHPVILKMLELKWDYFGRMGAFKMLLLNLFYILLWTTLAVGVPWQTRYAYDLPGTDIWRVVIWVLAVFLTFYYIGIEISEILTSRKKFKKWKDWKIQNLDDDIDYTHPKWPEERNYLEREKTTLDDMRSSYLQDFWNVFDWTVYFLNFAVLITHAANIVAYNDDNRPPPCCGSDGCDATATLIRTGNVTVKGSCALPDASVNNASLSVWVNRIFVINILMMWLRLMKMMRSFRTLGPFVVMLGKITYDILRFLFLYFEFYIPYACAFWMIFGDEPSIQSMFTVDQMLFSLYRITLVDEYEYEQMHAFDVVMAYFLCGTFLGISAILCINLFIALLSDTFQRVYDNAKANAVMQQAIQILYIEESLDSNKKDRFKRFIQKKCSPREEYYDDDLTVSQDDDLKKATIQIRSQMEEVLEYLRSEEKEKEAMAFERPSSRIQFSGQRSVGSRQSNLMRISSDLSTVINAVNSNRQGNEDTMKKMRNDIIEIKKMLRQLVPAKKSKKTDIVSTMHPPVFPLEITTFQHHPVHDLPLRRSQGFEGIRHPGLDRPALGSHTSQEDLMRRLIQSAEESRRPPGGIGQEDADFEMTPLPGSSGRITPQPNQAGPFVSTGLNTTPATTVVTRGPGGLNQPGLDEDEPGTSNA